MSNWVRGLSWPFSFLYAVITPFVQGMFRIPDVLFQEGFACGTGPNFQPRIEPDVTPTDLFSVCVRVSLFIRLVSSSSSSVKNYTKRGEGGGFTPKI